MKKGVIKEYIDRERSFRVLLPVSLGDTSINSKRFMDHRKKGDNYYVFFKEKFNPSNNQFNFKEIYSYYLPKNVFFKHFTFVGVQYAKKNDMNSALDKFNLKTDPATLKDSMDILDIFIKL